MTLSLNDRAAGARRPAGRRRRGAAAWRSPRCSNGTRVIDCGAQRRGGFEAGRRFAEICMGGLGAVATRRWSSTGAGCPASRSTTDRPAVACLAAQYAGWQLDHDGFFAMASGPGRALIRAEDLYDDLAWRRARRARRSCAWRRASRRRRRSPTTWRSAPACRASALTLLIAPTASVAGGVQIAARVVETALHKLHELDFDVRRVVARLRQLPARRRWRATTWRRSGAPTTRCSTAARSTSGSRPATTTSCATSSSGFPPRRRRTTASRSASVLKAADCDFYEIDPLLFSPAQIRLTSVASGRSFEAGARQPRGAGALVLGLTVAILGSSGGLARAAAHRRAGGARPRASARARARAWSGASTATSPCAAATRRLDGCDAVIVRGIPRGSLEQVIFRVDALHALEARGVTLRQRPARDRAHGRQVPRLGAAGARRRADAADDRLRAPRRRAARPSRSSAATSSSSRCSARWGPG